MDKKYITKSFSQTQKLGQKIAQEFLNTVPGKTAIVLGLQGNLGGGKTTFLQGFAKGLGIKDKILSPTFVVMKKFSPYGGSLVGRQVPGFRFQDFYHLDCYRLENEKDILGLGWEEIIKDSRNIVAVEWPEKIKKALPKNTTIIDFKFIDIKTREISFKTSG